jgi:hypothetical protein
MAALFDGTHVSLADVASLSADLQDLYPGQDLDIAVINHADPLFLKKILERCREHLDRILQHGKEHRVPPGGPR